jgi:CRP-like cAMP-binding protein
MERFKSFLQQQVTILEKDWEYISSRLRQVSFDKNAILTKQNEIESTLYFLEEGILHLYHETDNKDITLNIAFPNSFINSYTSFLSRQPSEFNLQALIPCRVIAVTHTDLHDIYQHTSCGHALGRMFSEQLFLYLSQRENAFMLQSPTARYLSLFKEQPRLIQEVPQKYLASYIGITPQALSRIRAKLQNSAL